MNDPYRIFVVPEKYFRNFALQRKIGIAILRWHEREAACRRIIMCLPVQLLF